MTTSSEVYLERRRRYVDPIEAQQRRARRRVQERVRRERDRRARAQRLP